MPYDLFWHGKPSLYYNYLEAYEQSKKNEAESFIEKENFKAWLQGFYVDYALACNHPFAKEKGKYLQKPVEITKKEKSKENISQNELTNEEEQRAIAEFMAFGQLAEAINKKNK